MRRTDFQRTNATTAKERVKQWLRATPAAYTAAEVLYENSLFARHIVVQGLGRRALGGPPRPSPFPARQNVITWDVPFPAWSRHDDLTAWLRAHGVRMREGGHTVYVPPQQALRRLIAPVVEFYPPGSGFKILKDCRRPERARYLHKHRRTLPLLVRMIGTPLDQLVSANYLYATGLGPRVWDVTAWGSGRSRCTVFVVDHVNGRAATPEECHGFLTRLAGLQRSGPLRVLIPEWEGNDDFRAPDCNGNLLYSAPLARPQYVDFQNFGLTRLPECDAFATRLTKLAGRLRESALAVAGRLVIDPACDDGATIAAALVRGAAWVLAWCRDDTAEAVEASLLATGFSRFTIVRGAPGVSLARGVPARFRGRPDDAVVFSCAGGHLRLERFVNRGSATEALQ